RRRSSPSRCRLCESSWLALPSHPRGSKTPRLGYDLNDFRCEADNFQEAAVAQLTGNRSENARPSGVLVFLVDNDHGVAIEAHVAAVVAARRLLDADDDALNYVARLDVAARDRFLHAGDDDVGQAGVAPPGAA